MEPCTLLGPALFALAMLIKSFLRSGISLLALVGPTSSWATKTCPVQLIHVSDFQPLRMGEKFDSIHIVTHQIPELAQATVESRKKSRHSLAVVLASHLWPLASPQLKEEAIVIRSSKGNLPGKLNADHIFLQGGRCGECLAHTLRDVAQQSLRWEDRSKVHIYLDAQLIFSREKIPNLTAPAVLFSEEIAQWNNAGASLQISSDEMLKIRVGGMLGPQLMKNLTVQMLTHKSGNYPKEFIFLNKRTHKRLHVWIKF